MDMIAAKRKAFDLLSTFGVLLTALGLVIYPAEMVAAAKSGLELCLNVMVPSLFPFFVVSTLVVELGLSDRLGRLLSPVMKPLFNVNGACASALILGFVGGYPVGAKTVISLYNSGACSKTEAERMLAFCNNSGPAFILGVVGTGIFSSATAGFVLYLAHMLSSLCVGLIFRFWKHRERPSRGSISVRPRVSFSGAFVRAAGGGFTSCLGICGFVIFFTVLLRLLFLSGFMGAASRFLGDAFSFTGLSPQWAEKLLTGVLELTSGVWSLRDAAGELSASMAMAAFMLGWAGLSVYCQVLSFIGDSGLSGKTYLMGKLLHGIFSALLTELILRYATLEAPVSQYLAMQVTDIAQLSFSRALTISGTLAAIVGVLYGGLVWLPTKKG